MAIAIPNRKPVRGVLPWAVLGLGLALLVVSVSLFYRPRGAAPSAGDPRETPAPAGGLPGSVTLAEGKLKAADLANDRAELLAMPSELGVPGRIDANLDREVQLHPRAPGVVREAKAALGQRVKKGDLLAVLDCPDVGTARLLLRAKQSELATVRVEAAWKKQVAENVDALVAELRKGVEYAEIDRRFSERALGNFYGTLMTAYAKYDMASHDEEKTTGLHKAQILGEHPFVMAKHTRESAQAEFLGSLQQDRYDARQQNLEASQKVKVAEGAVVDAAQRLRILGVPENVDSLIAQADRAPAARLDDDVSACRVVAPFDGTVVDKSAVAVPTQKVDVNDVLYTVADLDTVWVTANIPESDFGLLPALRGGKIRLEATAYPDRPLDARVLAVGAVVDPATRTVPMRAETGNPDGLLKIGMFVRIVLDTATAEKVLTVPSSAVVDVEGTTGVFSPDPKDKAGRTFAFRPVKLGREAGGRRVVASGLEPGDVVVSRGAFTLKSELILQNETEEE